MSLVKITRDVTIASLAWNLNYNLFGTSESAATFASAFQAATSHRHHEREFCWNLHDSTTEQHEPLEIDVDLPHFTCQDFLDASAKAAVPRKAETTDGAHDAFRYEWGKWVDEDDAMVELRKMVDNVRILNDNDVINFDGTERRRIRVAGSKPSDPVQWDMMIHVLPSKDDVWSGRWPTGSWVFVKSLIGVFQVSMLRGPNRDGFYNEVKSTAKQMRGGGTDGSIGSGSTNSRAARGDPCVKYVGGALRRYGGAGSGMVAALEVAIRPPNTELGSGENSENESEGWETFNGKIDQLIELVSAEEEEAENARKAAEEAEAAAIEKEAEQKQKQNEEESPSHLGTKLGMNFDKVGGLDNQLDAIVRRVLASRSNPEAARRLGISHVRGILLSGPPGCGKTLLARELSTLLGAREPQIVNGPEILDKFVGEAEKKVRDLFRPAEIEYAQVGDESALHVIVLDEMDAIAKARGSVSGDSTGVRDSVVNQLLAKMDGVQEANNVLVIGLTNRPELLDPALLRPGRLEVQLRVELPDRPGRRDILRIHTRRMKREGGLGDDAIRLLEDIDSDEGIPARTEHFTGAELAGLVRSSASFALARTVETMGTDEEETAGIVRAPDLERALEEVRPALGKQDDVLEARYSKYGVSACSPSMERIQRELERFTRLPRFQSSSSSSISSMLVVGAGGKGGAGATAMACWAASEASSRGEADYVRLITSLDLLVSSSSSSGDGETARAAALVDKFQQAVELPNALLVLDDIDQICSGTGGYSSVMIATLRALLRSPPASKAAAPSKRDESGNNQVSSRSLHILAATSRSDAACSVLHELFDETLVVPLLNDADSVQRLVEAAVQNSGLDVRNIPAMSSEIHSKLGDIGCKTALRIIERAVATAGDQEPVEAAQLEVLGRILEDMAGDDADTSALCEVY